MKKFKFTIRGNQYDVEIQKMEDNIAEIEVNGTSYQVNIDKEIKTSKTPTLIRRKTHQVHETDTAKTSKPAERKGSGAIKAPLPGTILEMKVKTGDSVTMGQTILVMEAMKMENDIKADRAGTITAVKVNNGDSVLEGDVLVEIGD